MAYTGGNGSSNGGFVYIALKPLGHGKDERSVGAMQVVNQLRPKLNRLPVASVFLQPVQDLRIGGRSSNALYQYTIVSDNIPDLAHWGPILLEHMKKLPGLEDVNTDQQNGGLEEMLDYNRVNAARLGQTAATLDSSLYSAFGQSDVSVIYTQLNQYYVVMEVAPAWWQSPAGLKDIWFNSGASSGGAGMNSRWKPASACLPPSAAPSPAPRKPTSSPWPRKSISSSPPSWPSTSSSAFFMRAWCTPSPFCPPSPRPPLAPCSPS
jgi:multidrug efflux pump